MSETPEEVLSRIAHDAYDPEVFGTADLAQVRAVLERSGWTLDTVSATIIRIMLPRVAGMLAAEGYRIVPDEPECQCYTVHEDRNAACPLNAD